MKNCVLITPLLALSSCAMFGGLSAEERDAVNGYRDRAGKYFNARLYERAIDQANSGLQLDPQNYDLHGRRAWSYLQLSISTSIRSDRDLLTAESIFSNIIDWRQDDDHDPRTLYGYAITLHNRARVTESQAAQLRDQPSPDSTSSARAEEVTNRSQAYDRQADIYFQKITDGNTAGMAIKRGAYKYRMAIHYRQKDLDTAIAFGEENLEINERETSYFQARYSETPSAEYESVFRQDLEALRTDEMKIRSRLAMYHQEKGEFRAAIVHLDAILEDHPSRVEDYYLRGNCHRALKQHAETRADFRKFLQLGKKLPQTHPSVRDAREYLYGG